MYDCDVDINVGDKCEKGAQLRPHIVWFGEDVPLLQLAAEKTASAHIVMVVGSSMQVYPAAGLVAYSPQHVPVFYIDKNPAINHELKVRKNLQIIADKATVGVREIVKNLMNDV